MKLVVIIALLVGVAHADPKLTKPPQLAHFVAAPYPPALQAAGIEGAVVVQIDLAIDGTVVDAVVQTSSGQPDFDAAAVTAVRQFTFTPAEVDGAPSPIRILYQYDFKLAQVAPTTASFSGVVRADGAVLAGIEVAIGDKRAITDDAGRFAIDEVPPGEAVITVSGKTITTVQTHETFEAGKRLDVVYDVTTAPPAGASDGDDLEIVITAPQLAKSAAKVEVVAAQARVIAGTGGDVLKVVENLPGVARAEAGSGALVAWGASPEDTLVYVDGVPVPRLYHIGGLRSVIATDLVKSIALEPGGWGAAHGRGLGGIVDVSLIDLDDKQAGAVQIDAVDSAAAARLPIADGIDGAIALRKSQLGWLIDHLDKRDTGELFPIPSYADGQARLAFQLAPKRTFEIAALGSTDDVTRTVASEDPAATRSDRQIQRFARLWLHYRDERDGDVTDAVIYGGLDQTRETESYGALPTDTRNTTDRYGARASWRTRLATWATAELGFDGEVAHARLSRTGSLALPAREGDVRVFGEPPPDQLAADAWRVVTATAAPYAQVDAALLDGALHVVPGLRVEPYFESVSRSTPIVGDVPAIGRYDASLAVQPRFAARYALGKLSLGVAVGRYKQAPQPGDLSAVFGSPTLPLATATHYVAKVAYAPTELLGIELTGFRTELTDLAVRSELATPRLAEALEPTGTGHTTGVQALVRLSPTHGVFGWISYTLSRAVRRDAPDQTERLFDYDQTHVLTALGSVKLAHGIELGARIRYATGAPRTPVIGAYYDARLDEYQPLFGARSSQRLPAFVQLDVRAAKHFGNLEVYVDLQNITDRDNAEEVVYDPTFTHRGYITSLPILPIAGARYVW